MISNRLLASLNWKLAKLIGKRGPKSATRRFVAAYRLEPSNLIYAQRAVDALINLGSYEAARRICAEQIKRDDRLAYWKHFDSFIEELEDTAPRPEKAAAAMQVAMFNDTDRRPNIGCRLTSQSFKGTVKAAFPDCKIVSNGFRFGAFLAKPSSKPRQGLDLLRRELELLVEAGFGATAINHLNASQLVVLQPEGSLDDDVGLHGVLTFCSPILLAALTGKRTIIINGTLPTYKDERAKLLRDLFDLADIAVARDQLSAEAYGIPFVPDAAMLFEPTPFEDDRDSCLITTGARNSADRDRQICRMALELCKELQLRPVVLSRASGRFAEFKGEIARMGGIFAETASLKLASETVSRCRLHVGGRYHMAILALTCGVPSLLFNVKTGKNQWLAQFSPLIKLVGIDEPLLDAARDMSTRAGRYPAPRKSLRETYVELLRRAANTDTSDKIQSVQTLFNTVAAR